MNAVEYSGYCIRDAEDDIRFSYYRREESRAHARECGGAEDFFDKGADTVLGECFSVRSWIPQLDDRKSPFLAGIDEEKPSANGISAIG